MAFKPPPRVVSREADPSWNAAQSHRLCKKGEESKFNGKAELLDVHKFNSIRSTVDILNREGCDSRQVTKTGFCIVFSSGQECYFLLYRRECQKEAFEAFDIRGLWSEGHSDFLCMTGEESLFEGRAVLLDSRLNCKSVAQAVRLLNFPHDAPFNMTPIPDICIVLVEATKRYHMLWIDGEDDAAATLRKHVTGHGRVRIASSDSTPPTVSKLEAMQSRLASKVNGVFKFWGWGGETDAAADADGEDAQAAKGFDPTMLTSSYARALSDKYDILNQLGSGAQGTAHLVRKKNASGESSLFVAKETHDMSKSGVDDFKKEFDKMAAMRHPNCLRVFELLHYEPKQQMFIITDYAKGGDLYRYMHVMMQNEEELNENVVAKMMQQAMKGVSFLHASGFVHNDIKPDNLLVMEEYKKGAAPRVVVADYGCATLENESGKIFFGDPRYMSPEAMKSMMKYMEEDAKTEQSGPNVDVWAMGVTIYQFLGKDTIPFLYESCNLKDVKGVFPRLRKALLSKAEVKFTDKGGEEMEFSDAAQDLLKQMLHKDVKKRFTAAQSLEHEWFHTLSRVNSPQQKHGLQAAIRFHATRDSLRQILRNAVAAKLRYEHVEHSFKIFSKFDPDNSGSISQDEFIQAWKECDPDSENGAMLAKEYFERADVDGNKQLEFNEFAAITLDWESLKGEVLDQHLLDLFDKEVAGAEKLDIPAFKRCFADLGQVQEVDLERCARSIDVDGDGVITLEELKWFIQKGAETGAGYVDRAQASTKSVELSRYSAAKRGSLVTFASAMTIGSHHEEEADESDKEEVDEALLELMQIPTA